MLSIMKMASRNIGRNRRRTALTALTVMAVVMIIIFLLGYLSGIMDAMFDNSARMATGHLKIEAQGYADREALMPLELAVPDSAKVAAAVAPLPHVARVARRIQFFTMVQRGRADEFPVIMGLEPGPERDIIMAGQKLARGKWFSEKPREAVIGFGLAQKLGIISPPAYAFTPGADIEILAPRGIPMSFKVVGVFRFGYSLLDDKVIFVKFADAQYAADFDADDMATDVLVLLDDRNLSIPELPVVRAAAEAVTGPGVIEVMPWQAQGFLYQTMQTMYGVIAVVIAILFFICASTILNTMLMAVMERYRELGMLMSLGMKPREVVAMIVVEAVTIGVLGGAAGAVLGGIVTFVLSKTGIPVGAALENLPMPIGDTIRVLFLWWSIPLGFAFGLAMTVISSIYPALKASRLSPTEALRTI